VLNRAHQPATTEIDGPRAAEASAAIRAEHPVAADVLLVHAVMMARAEREQAVFSQFSRAHPDVAVAVVAAQPVDVHDVDGLREIGEALSLRPAPGPSA